MMVMDKHVCFFTSSPRLNKGLVIHVTRRRRSSYTCNKEEGGGGGEGEGREIGQSLIWCITYVPVLDIVRLRLDAFQSQLGPKGAGCACRGLGQPTSRSRGQAAPLGLARFHLTGEFRGYVLAICWAGRSLLAS